MTFGLNLSINLGSVRGSGGTPPPPTTAPGYLDATTAPYAAYGPQRMVAGYVP